MRFSGERRASATYCPSLRSTPTIHGRWSRNAATTAELAEGLLRKEITMIYGIVLSSTMAAVLVATPALAGPCAGRIAELEKSVIAAQEGAGAGLAPPASSGTSLPSSPQAGTQGVPAASPDTVRANAMLQMLSQAKQLDQQGKEAECMQI